MSRALRIELSARNIVLFVLGLGAFTAGVAFASQHFGVFSKTDAKHHDNEHGKHEVEKHEEREHPEKSEHEESRIQLSPEALKNADLEILSAGPGEVRVTLSLPGEVSLNQDALAHVTPRVPGTAREVRKQVGETVTKGEVLAVLDSRDLAEAQRDFLANKERLALAEGNFARAEQLQKENISAEKDFLFAKQALAEARIEHRSAAQKLQAIGGGGGSGGYVLIAPLAGTIIEKHVSVGEVLNEATRAFTIADLSSIWVNVTVYAKDLPRVATGQSAEVRAEGLAEPAFGAIDYLGRVVGEQTRSAIARIVLKDPGIGWRPGLFATAEVSVDRAMVPLIVPATALQSIEGKNVVFVQEGDAFEARSVVLGRKGRAKNDPEVQVVEVLEGLTAGERVVAKNSFLLKAELGKSEAGHEH